MDALINAMGTPEEHDARMRAWAAAEAKVLNGDPAEGDGKSNSDSGWRDRKNGGRGLHSSTFRLNLSALCEIGGARRDCVARITGV